MRKAIVVEAGGLGAPAVGTWIPVSDGDCLSTAPKGLIGEIRQNGRAILVCAPDEKQQIWAVHCPRGSWVSYGQTLLMPTGAKEAHADVTKSEAPTEESMPKGFVAVRAETDGTLYLRPDPSAPAFAQEGVQVEEKAVLALIEVMKTFSPVRAPQTGTIQRVLVTDGASVEAGDVVFWMA